jgi:hypothetical protein
VELEAAEDEEVGMPLEGGEEGCCEDEGKA